MILKLIAILINFFLMLNAKIVFTITDYLDIDKVLNFLGTPLIGISIIIMGVSIYNKLTNNEKTNPIVEKIAKILTVFSIITAISITLNITWFNDITNMLIIDIYTPMSLEMKKQLYDTVYVRELNDLFNETKIDPSPEVLEYIKNMYSLPNDEILKNNTSNEVRLLSRQNAQNTISAMENYVKAYEPKGINWLIPGMFIILGGLGYLAFK